MIKKFSSILTALSLSFLVACGSNPTQTASPESTGKPGNEKITVTWWNSVDDEAEAKALDDLVAKYEKANPNVKIEQSFVPFSDIKNKLLTSSVGNELPDIVWLDNPDHQSFAAAGILADITKEVQEWGQSNQYFEGPWSSTVLKDKSYGVPVSSNNLALIYNEKMLKDAGIQPPKTWDELKEAAKNLTKSGVYGLGVAAKQNETATFQLLPWIWQAGSDLNSFDSQGTIDAIKFWKDLVDNGYMSKEVINLKHGDLSLQFASQKVAMMVNGTWNLGSDLKDAKFEWNAVPLPSYKQSATILGGFNWAITSQSKQKEAAWDFIKFANEPDNIREFVKTSGRLPSRKDMIQEPNWQDNKIMKVFADSMENSRARSYGPNYPKISSAVQEMVQSVLTGVKSPEDAVKDANAKIKPLLQ
ncbi:sugar ABC transporter substrate-binding protein [Ammoniphilus sp. 3BR4]|uniref:ABC transporter substrate-binding protein n=1 Tax=Ammoniphilus sp. 3BR4 TaxID=3158265 RepID=UPI003467CCF4